MTSQGSRGDIDVTVTQTVALSLLARAGFAQDGRGRRSKAGAPVTLAEDEALSSAPAPSGASPVPSLLDREARRFGRGPHPDKVSNPTAGSPRPSLAVPSDPTEKMRISKHRSPGAGRHLPPDGAPSPR